MTGVLIKRGNLDIETDRHRGKIMGKHMRIWWGRNASGYEQLGVTHSLGSSEGLC